MRSVFISLVIFFIHTVAYASPIIFNDKEEKTVTNGFDYFFDSTKSLTIQNILQAIRGGTMQPVNPSLVIKNGYNVYWLHFSLQNQTKYDQDFILDFQNWSYVDAYILEGDQYILHKTGHLYPYNKRDYKVANKAYILGKIKSGETKDCIIRLESKYNNELVPSSLNFIISPRTIIENENDRTGKVIYAFLSMFFIMFIYNLFISFSTRLRSYSLYLVVIFFAFYHTAYNSGYLVELFGSVDKFPIWLTYFETFSSNFFGIAIILFATEFLSVKQRYPGWHKVFRILVYSFIALLIVLAINKEVGSLLSSLAGLVTIVAIIVVAIKSTKAKYPAAVYFLVGFSVFLLSILVILLAVLNVLPLNFWTLSFALPVGTSIEITFFAFALGNLINRLRLENEKNQEKIIAQLEENQSLQTKVNRELEEKVKERTIEINKQKEQISIQKEKIEIEKEKSEELLLNMLPEFTANELKEKGYAVPKRYENVSILFTDFVDFTKISEKLHPVKLVEDLDACFKSFDEIISNNRLEKIKTIGDSYMAICGAPVADASHALNTVNAAIQIRKFIENWNIEKINQGEAPWEIRIGIHSGYVIGGVVGKKKFTFDIWSDTVNTASRMESSGANGKINISGTTYELIKDNFTCEYRGKVKAKNKGEMDMYFVTG